MFSRLKSIVYSLATVLGAYLAYRLLAVPWLEPALQRRESLVPADDGSESEVVQKLRGPQLAALFPPGSWELDHPKVLETDEGMLLLRDYQPLPDGRLSLQPCTLIYCPAEAKKPAPRTSFRRAVVLQAPQGAVLRFDREMDLARGQIGRLEGGRLVGPVVIRSPESKPGAGDELEVRTQNVQVTPDRILAPENVAFQYGPNAGRGRDLTVTLGRIERAAPRNKDRTTDRQLAVGAPQLLELVHVEKLELNFQAAGDLPAAANAPAHAPRTRSVRLELTCRGPFKYDFLQRVATFEDRVDVVRPNPQGPNDQLTCQQLAIYLTAPEPGPKPDGGGGAMRASAGFQGIEVERLEARGFPAVLRVPSYAAAVRGELLEYNFRTRQVRIEDSQKLLLRYQQHEFETRRLEYQFADAGKLGLLRALGPGRLRGTLPEDARKPYEAAWRERLVMQPHQGCHAVSLIAGAHVRCQGLGDFTADSMHVWLREVAQPPGQDGRVKTTYVPDRMLADRDVRIDSPQLSAATQRAELWLRYANPGAPPVAVAETVGPARRTDAAGEPPPSQKFDAAGDTIQLQLLRQGRDVVVEHLILDGSVRFRESRTAKATDLPLDVRGTIVQVDHANTPLAQVRVQGQPAEVSARGLSLIGDNLQLNRGDSRLWVAGPGTMTLPASVNGLGGDRPPAGPRATVPLNVTWTGRMEFDGQQAHFLNGVRVRGTQASSAGEVYAFTVTGQELDVALTRRVDLTQNEQQAKPAVQQLAFRGAVLLENQGSRQGQPISFDQLHVADLTIQHATGDLQARGPGWGSSVRHRVAPVPRAERQDPVVTPRSGPPELAYVRVDFEEQLTGNLHRREVEFQGRVRALYGPVANWDQTLDPDPLTGLGPGELLLTSERLTLAEVGSSDARGEAAVEMVAIGNASVEGDQFTARGARISYAHAKELVLLEGDGRNDAELWRKGSSAPDAAAQQIRFWTRDNRIQVDGARFLNLGQLGRTLR